MIIHIKKYQYEIYLTLIILTYTFFLSGLTGQLVSLPGPALGGDLYHQQGAIYHVMETPISEWADATNVQGSRPAYFVTYSVFNGVVGNLFGLSPLESMIFTSYLILIAGIIFSYLLFNNLFNNKLASLFGALIFIPFTRFPIFKYSGLLIAFFMPLFFLLLFRKRTWNNSILFGIVGGLMSLTHSLGFFIFFAGLILWELYQYILSCFEFKNSVLSLNLKSYDWSRLKPLGLCFAIAFFISLPWWFGPLFIHHGSTLSLSEQWSFPDLTSLSNQIEFIWTTIQNSLFNFNSILNATKSILALSGLFFIFRNFQKYSEISFAFIFSMIMTFNVIILEPIFGLVITPFRFREFLMWSVIVIIATFGLYKLIKLIKIRWVKYTILGILIVSTMYLGIEQSYESFESNQWKQVGKQLEPEPYRSLGTWLRANTHINDVILSNNELSFALNGVSGRKLLVSRRAQTDPYMDMEERQAAAAIILYGNDTQKRNELIEKFDIKYLYWDYMWANTDYFIQNGQAMGYNDPLALIDFGKGEEGVFDKYGIKYRKMNYWLDPAGRTEAYNKMDLIFVQPDNYRSGFEPWTADMDPLLEEVWTFEAQGQKLARLFKINREMTK